MLRPFTSLSPLFLPSLSLPAGLSNEEVPHASSESDFSERANPETLRKYVAFDLSALHEGSVDRFPWKSAEEYVKT